MYFSHTVGLSVSGGCVSVGLGRRAWCICKRWGSVWKRDGSIRTGRASVAGAYALGLSGINVYAASTLH
jgi:hypothetical protein